MKLLTCDDDLFRYKYIVYVYNTVLPSTEFLVLEKDKVSENYVNYLKYYFDSKELKSFHSFHHFIYNTLNIKNFPIERRMSSSFIKKYMDRDGDVYVTNKVSYESLKKILILFELKS